MSDDDSDNVEVMETLEDILCHLWETLDEVSSPSDVTNWVHLLEVIKENYPGVHVPLRKALEEVVVKWSVEQNTNSDFTPINAAEDLLEFLNSQTGPITQQSFEQKAMFWLAQQLSDYAVMPVVTKGESSLLASTATTSTSSMTAHSLAASAGVRGKKTLPLDHYYRSMLERDVASLRSRKKIGETSSFISQQMDDGLLRYELPENWSTFQMNMTITDGKEAVDRPQEDAWKSVTDRIRLNYKKGTAVHRAVQEIQSLAAKYMKGKKVKAEFKEGTYKKRFKKE